MANDEKQLVQAEAELDGAEKKILLAAERYKKIKPLLDKSATSVDLDYRLMPGKALAQLGLERARFSVEQMMQRLKILREYEKNRRVNELRSAVEKARSDELARNASMELEQGKLKRLDRPNPEPSAAQKGALDLLGKALGIEGEIRDTLDRLARNGKPDAELQTATTKAIGELEKVIDQAEFEADGMNCSVLERDLSRARAVYSRSRR